MFALRIWLGLTANEYKGALHRRGMLEFSCQRASPITHGRRAHWPKSTELLNFDVVGSRGL